MDNPWATAWDHPRAPHDQDTAASWSAPQWPAAQGTAWSPGDAPWDSSTDAAPEQDQRQLSALVAAKSHSATAAPTLDHQTARSTLLPQGSSVSESATIDANPRGVVSVSGVTRVENLETTLNPPGDDWGMAWDATPSNANPKQTQPPDQWEAALQEKAKLHRAVPSELLDSLLRHCQQVSQEIWPASEVDNEDCWRTGFDSHSDITALLAQLVPTDPTLPPAVHFSTTATAGAMNEALKLTRHLPESASSPLSRLLASKGSLEWEKSIKTEREIALGTSQAGWRVLEKEDRLNTLEESKPTKATGGLLSFWSRRTSAIQPAAVEALTERSRSPARSSLESAKSTSRPPSSRAASPSRASTTPAPAPPSTDCQLTVPATASAPSAVSRFLSRFSRTKGAQHTSLALSSDDLEFLSDIVPSANDPLDEDVNDSVLNVLTGAADSSHLPPTLPPPILPPPKQPLPSNRPLLGLGPGSLDGASATGSAPLAFRMQAANHAPNVPVLAPTLSLRPAAAFSRTQSPSSPPKDVAMPTVISKLSNTPSVQQTLQPSSQSHPQPSSFSTPLPKAPPLLSIPLLPPPPVSPPQTPRPSASPSITSAYPFATHNTDISSFHDPDGPDDEFSAFTSFPPSAPGPFPSSEPYPSQKPSSPPSPPPRRSYERTHYPSSSSTSSILGPASRTSLDQLCPTRTSISASLDSFDDFVPPLEVVRDENRQRAPSPPPLPVKPQFQRQQPPRLDTLSSRVRHSHTPSQTFASPTARTSLMNNAFSVVSSVSDAEHGRTQSLVDHAAARGGTLWPNSPDLDEPRVRVIPPPPPTSTSPKLLTGQEGFDLLGDGDPFNGGSGAFSTPFDAAGDASRSTFGVVGGPSEGLGLRGRLQPSPPPLPSTFAPVLSFSSLGTSATATNAESIHLTKPKQTGGLSAQDLLFFEGL